MDWTCSCGTLNHGNFCPHCGKKRPEGNGVSEPSCKTEPLKLLTTLPYSSNGLCVESLTIDSVKHNLDIVYRNDCGGKIAARSSMEFVLKYGDGIVLWSGFVEVQSNLAAGERCRCTFPYNKNAATLEIGESKILYREPVPADVKINNILPYESNGLIVENADFEHNLASIKMTLTVLNDTGREIVNYLTKVPCDVFDADGRLLKSLDFRGCAAAGERYTVTWTIPGEAASACIGECTAGYTSNFPRFPVREYDGVLSNKCPVALGDITLIDVCRKTGDTISFELSRTDGRPWEKGLALHFEYLSSNFPFYRKFDRAFAAEDISDNTGSIVFTFTLDNEINEFILESATFFDN